MMQLISWQDLILIHKYKFKIRIDLITIINWVKVEPVIEEINSNLLDKIMQTEAEEVIDEEEIEYLLWYRENIIIWKV